ncbi:MAG TPA: DUF4232 domain-containing protein [Ktedonobacterales bacterium]
MRGISGFGLRKNAMAPILALALAATLAACGSASTSKGSGTTGASATTGGCQNLSLLGPATNNIAGHIRYSFAVANGGASPCTLEGYPKVTLDTSAITVITTTSAATWSNVAIEPVTLAPNSFATFAVQGYDQTTGCQFVNLSIELPQQTTSAPYDTPISFCGGKIYVSPIVSSPQAFNQ